MQGMNSELGSKSYQQRSVGYYHDSSNNKWLICIAMVEVNCQIQYNSDTNQSKWLTSLKKKII